MDNKRFATAMHILTLLADSTAEWQSSEWIAGSINVHPVVVRKELAVLISKGLVISKKGKEGGSKLAVDSKKMLLSDIYQAVNQSDILGKKNADTNPNCPIGMQINEKLTNLFDQTDDLVLKHLSKKTLADFVKQFK